VPNRFPESISKTFFNSRPHDIFKAIMYTECGIKHRKNWWDLCACLVHTSDGRWIGGRLIKDTNA
jgi:hypothetical protein